MSHFDKPSCVLPLDNSTRRRVMMDPDPRRAASGHVQRFERSISIPVSPQHLSLESWTGEGSPLRSSRETDVRMIIIVFKVQTACQRHLGPACETPRLLRQTAPSIPEIPRIVYEVAPYRCPAYHWVLGKAGRKRGPASHDGKSQ